jgi:hypothetical protein
MNREMAELRKLLDLFEGAGFTVTYISANYLSHHFEIVLKSSSIIKIEDFEHETATASTVANLVEENGYRITDYHIGSDVNAAYAGTIYFKIIS